MSFVATFFFFFLILSLIWKSPPELLFLVSLLSLTVFFQDVFWNHQSHHVSPETTGNYLDIVIFYSFALGWSALNVFNV